MSRKKSKSKTTYSKPLMFCMVVVAAVLGVTLAYLLFTNWYITDYYAVPVEFQVVEPTHIGIALNGTILQYGKVPQGGSARKRVTVSAFEPSVVHIRVLDDDVAKLMTPPTQTMVLDKNESTDVRFVLEIPLDYPRGNYTGFVTFTYTKRFPWQ